MKSPCSPPGCLCKLVEPPPLPAPRQAQHLQEGPRCEHAAHFCSGRHTACWGKEKWGKQGKLLSKRASERLCKPKSWLLLLDMTYTGRTSRNARKEMLNPRISSGYVLCQEFGANPWAEEQHWLLIPNPFPFCWPQEKVSWVNLGKIMQMGLDRKQLDTKSHFILLAWSTNMRGKYSVPQYSSRNISKLTFHFHSKYLPSSSDFNFNSIHPSGVKIFTACL